jgi:hypothetical protein
MIPQERTPEMPLSNHDASKPFANRSVLDRRAVNAMGDLLMLGVRLERRSRGASERLGSFDPSGIFRRP